MKRTILTLIAATLLILSSTAAHAQIFPTVTLSPNPLEFDDTRVGSTSASMTITATATGGSLPTYIFTARLSDTASFDIVSDGCSGVALESGDSCDVDLDFSPEAMGHYSSSFFLISLSQSVISSALVEGRGVAPRVVLSTTSIDFGPQTVNRSSTGYEVLLTNSGNEALSISSIEASDNFAVADDCGASVAAEGSCNLEVTFTPDAQTAFTGTVTITDDASDSPQTIALSGTGIAEGQEDASLSRHSIDFGNQLANTTSDAEQVTLESTGTVPLTINSITASANFAVAHDCVSPLASDATCTLDITFSPNAAGSFSGTVTIDDGASDSPQQISLVGVGIENSGPQASLSANALDFGDQTQNTKSDPQVITITNSGDANLSVEDVSTGGQDPTNFDATDTCHQSSVAPGETCQVSVTFDPTGEGTFTATITITDNSGSSPHLITVSGVGIANGSSGGGCSISGSATAVGFAPLLLLLGLAALRKRGKR